MTTAKSPLPVLRAQADRMARILKAVERGDQVPEDKSGKLAASRKSDHVKFAIAMDDKLLSVQMNWDVIATTSEAGISEFILDRMRESREAPN